MSVPDIALAVNKMDGPKVRQKLHRPFVSDTMAKALAERAASRAARAAARKANGAAA